MGLKVLDLAGHLFYLSGKRLEGEGPSWRYTPDCYSREPGAETFQQGPDRVGDTCENECGASGILNQEVIEEVVQQPYERQSLGAQARMDYEGRTKV